MRVPLVRDVEYELPYIDPAATGYQMDTSQIAGTSAGAHVAEHECSLEILGDDLVTLLASDVGQLLASIVPGIIGDFTNDTDF
ncbi:hypothetical protein NDU88_005339 [Pleurodeles waltl]|uniref:Uncharacterized protein n=1 Tax=Pleurodeles waltl TaxID=8319 RepID=A0AAV7TCB2_PLEWA|nr:hypothetical protein NDU88_005339 [Pleurodeles waltl]